MRLSLKLALVTTVMTAFIILVQGWFSVHREAALLETGIVNDTRLVAESLSAVLEHASLLETSEPRVRGLLGAVNREEGEVSVHWMSLLPMAPLPLPEEYTAALLSGRPVEFRTVDKNGNERFHSVKPVVKLGRAIGAVDASASLARRDAYVRRVFVYSSVAVLFVTLASGVLATLLGRGLVGRRVEELVRKSRSVAAGDYGEPVPVRGNDELAQLAREMNRMSDDLSQARQSAAAEVEARIQAEVQLRHADRLTTVGHLAAGVAHELGSPLNVISGRAELIARREAGEEARADARIIVEQSRRITRIVQRLLDFSRRSGRPPEVRDIGRLAAESVDLLASTARKAGVELVAEAHEGPTCRARVDEGQVQQVLANLVMNGIQAMPKGGTLAVVVSRGPCPRPPPGHQAGENHVHIDVVDEGVGMTPDVVERAFDPFFTTKEPGAGTGLGLSVAHGILRDHGGGITVVSEPGKGSTFTAHLPAVEAEVT